VQYVIPPTISDFHSHWDWANGPSIKLLTGIQSMHVEIARQIANRFWWKQALAANLAILTPTLAFPDACQPHRARMRDHARMIESQPATPDSKHPNAMKVMYQYNHNLRRECL
jgi:hypothetical protein